MSHAKLDGESEGGQLCPSTNAVAVLRQYSCHSNLVFSSMSNLRFKDILSNVHAGELWVNWP